MSAAHNARSHYRQLFLVGAFLFVMGTLFAQPSQAQALAIRVNAGGSAYTDTSGNAWSADTDFAGGSTVDWSLPSTEDLSTIAGTNDPALFLTERYGAFQYALSLPNGTYQVNLYFAENYVDSTFPNGGIGYTVFTVQANGVTIISNLDVFATVGSHAALIEGATVTVTNDQLVLSSPTPGGWSVNAIEVIGQGAAAGPPTVPAGLAATPVSTSQIQLSWTASTSTGSGVGGYSVYRGGVQVGSSAAGVTTYTDTGLAANTQYSYTVSAFDQTTPTPNGSAQSTPASATTLVTPASVLRINAGGQAYTDSVGNAWSADTGFNSSDTTNWGSIPIAGTSDPTLYHTERFGPNLQYSFTLPNGIYQINLHFAENYVNSTFPNGGIGYRVFGVEANGVPIISNLDVFATVGAHAALVESATVTVTTGQLVLSSPTASGWFVDAIEVIGQGEGTTSPITEPTGLAARPISSSQILLSWNASSDPGGSGVGGYYVFRGGVMIATTNAAVTYYTDNGLSAGTAYSYTVSAVDQATPPNQSAPSAPALATTVAANGALGAQLPGGALLTVPTQVNATAVSSSQINVSWTASTDTEGTGVGGYYVYRDGDLVATTNATTTSYSDTGLTGSTTYNYGVSAFDQVTPVHNDSLESFPLVSATTLPAPAGAVLTVPSGLSATAVGSSQINLSWTASTDSGGPGVGGYYVYRNGDLVATTNATITTYSDMGLNAGTQYSYTVSALDQTTPTPNFSVQSGPALATTVAGPTPALRIHAGGAAYTDISGNVWSTDTDFTGGSTVNWSLPSTEDLSTIAGTSDPALFLTERYGAFQYAFALPNGTYQVNLYFAENYVNSTFPNGGIGDVVFSVQANGVPIISNLDVFATVGAHAALIESATVTVTNGQLVLSSPTPGGWSVNAIEVISQPATFTALTPTMTSARENHASTLLTNGKVLITGGSSSSGGLNTAEFYDPLTNTFTAASATMTSVHRNHTATLLPSGKVLIAGGIANSTTAPAELYDPMANSFTALGVTMTTPRYGHTATLLPSGLVLITGGIGNGSTYLNTAELYDPVANTFTALSATMTTHRYGHTATLLPSGLVLITGGMSALGSPSTLSLNTAELYDPVANTFTALGAAMSSTRLQHTATLLPDGTVLITGGLASSGARLNTAEVYDPVTATFTALSATMTTQRYSHAATLLPNGRVLLTGGFGPLRTAELYEP